MDDDLIIKFDEKLNISPDVARQLEETQFWQFIDETTPNALGQPPHHLRGRALGIGNPMHITVLLHDPRLLPAVQAFVTNEGLHLERSSRGLNNEYMISYPRPDFSEAKSRLERLVTDLY